MIRYKENLKVAMEVLNAINSLSQGDEFEHFYVECYANGREHGYTIKGWENGKSFACSFSEHRNSDNIVIYFGEITDFSMQGNVPEEEAYANSKHFPHGQTYEAASFIIEKMRDLLAQAAKSPAVAV